MALPVWNNIGKHISLWYLLYRRATKAQASLRMRTCADSPEPIAARIYEIKLQMKTQAKVKTSYPAGYVNKSPLALFRTSVSLVLAQFI